MEYFGFLKLEKLENSDTDELIDFLVNNDLFEEAVEETNFVFPEDFYTETNFKESINLFFSTLYEFTKMISMHLKEDLHQKLNIDKDFRTDFNTFSTNQDQKIKLQPTQNLIDDFYKFLIELHDEEIANIKFTFYKKYNEKIFGLNIKAQRAIALKNYKKIYKIIFDDNIIYMPNEDSDEDFETYKLKVENKLKMVYRQQLKYKYKLSTLYPFFSYLTGDESIFTKSFYNKNQKTLEDVQKYEALKEIMVELNSKFEFEENFFINKKEDEKSIENLIPHTNKVEYKNKENNFKLGNSKNSPIPFIDFIRHENKIEIERIIKTHYSDLKGVSLRYLIEFLKEEGVLVLNHGDATKFYNSIKILFEGKNIGAYTSIFDSKVFSSTDKKYTTAKISFAKMFKDIL